MLKNITRALIVLVLVIGYFQTNTFVYAGDGTTGDSCNDPNGTCGGPWPDVDCAASYLCNNPPPDTAPGTCQPSATCDIECGTAGTYNARNENGGCNPGQQCRQISSGNWQCASPNVGECGNCSADGESCTHNYQCCGGACTVQQSGGGVCGGQSCIPYGNVCSANGTPVPGGCCGGVNCTQYTDGNSYCGDPFAIFDEPVVPSEYSGPIVDYQSFLFNVYRLMLPISVGLIGIPIVVMAGYAIMTSQGDPMRVKSGKEELTAAIAGILFLLLALSILRIILKSFLGQ